MSTNILINSRSMNGIITISDGSATLENGDLSCDDVNSSTLTTGTINTNILLVQESLEQYNRPIHHPNFNNIRIRFFNFLW